MRAAFLFAIIITLVSCTTTLEVPQKRDLPTITEQRPSVEKKDTEESVEDVKRKSKMLKEIEEERNNRELTEKSKYDLMKVDEAYELESKKPLEDKSYDTPLALAEDYLKKYSNTQRIDKDYMHVESVVIACLSLKGEYSLLLRFIESSATMTQTPVSDPARAYPLRMKAGALHRLGRTEEAKQTYRKVVEDYRSAIRDVTMSIESLEKIERSEVEYGILKTKLDKAIAYAKEKTVKASLAGLGEVKFSMSVDDVKQVKPAARFDIHGQGECKYKGVLYGCVTWREDFYGYDARVTVQFVSRKKIDQIVVFFYAIKNKGICPQFRGGVLVELIRKYGIPNVIDKKYTWNLDGGELEYSDICLDVDELLFSTVSLKPHLSGI